MKAIHQNLLSPPATLLSFMWNLLYFCLGFFETKPLQDLNASCGFKVTLPGTVLIEMISVASLSQRFSPLKPQETFFIEYSTLKISPSYDTACKKMVFISFDQCDVASCRRPKFEPLSSWK